jgi:hypothetical protein
MADVFLSRPANELFASDKSNPFRQLSNLLHQMLITSTITGALCMDRESAFATLAACGFKRTGQQAQRLLDRAKRGEIELDATVRPFIDHEIETVRNMERCSIPIP